MRSEVRWENRRKDDRVATNADQAEFAAILYGFANTEAGAFDDRVASALDDYELEDPRGTPRWARDDLALDSAVSDIGAEIRRRSQLLGEAYPFRVSGGRLEYRRSSTLVYEFCLAVSLSPSLNEGRLSCLPIIFERLARDAIAFLGTGAKGCRTGWPPDEQDDRPARLKDVVNSLHAKTGEWIWSPEAGLADDPTPEHVKDEGVDFVVWKEVPDHRGGRLFLLGQCACGNHFAAKFHEIDAQFTRLSRWIRPISWAWPMRVFVIPRHVPNVEYFQQINKEAGLTFDRLRITLLAEAANESRWVTTENTRTYAEFIDDVVAGFAADQSVSEQPQRKAAAGRRARKRED